MWLLRGTGQGSWGFEIWLSKKAWSVGKQAAGSPSPMCRAKHSTGFWTTLAAASEMIQHSSGIFLPNKTNARAAHQKSWSWGTHTGNGSLVTQPAFPYLCGSPTLFLWNAYLPKRVYRIFMFAQYWNVVNLFIIIIITAKSFYLLKMLFYVINALCELWALIINKSKRQAYSILL